MGQYNRAVAEMIATFSNYERYEKKIKAIEEIKEEDIVKIHVNGVSMIPLPFEITKQMKDLFQKEYDKYERIIGILWDAYCGNFNDERGSAINQPTDDIDPHFLQPLDAIWTSPITEGNGISIVEDEVDYKREWYRKEDDVDCKR